jgi:hypothetical protein
MEEYRKAYGGLGVDASYGSVEGERLLLWVQNGSAGGPVVTPDQQFTHLEAITGAIEAPGTATTRCVALGFPTVVVAKPISAGSVAAAKERVLGGREGGVVCTRRDAARNVTVQATAGAPSASRATSLSDASRRLAEAVDGVFTSVVR